MLNQDNAEKRGRGIKPFNISNTDRKNPWHVLTNVINNGMKMIHLKHKSGTKVESTLQRPLCWRIICWIKKREEEDEWTQCQDSRHSSEKDPIHSRVTHAWLSTSGIHFDISVHNWNSMFPLKIVHSPSTEQQSDTLLKPFLLKNPLDSSLASLAASWIFFSSYKCQCVGETALCRKPQQKWTLGLGCFSCERYLL